MKIVLSGPSAAPYAREYISNAAATLREKGHDVFVPHEGGWQAPESPAERDRFDFEMTYSALCEADLLMAVLDGYTVDDAVALQVGAYHVHAREGSQQRRIMGILHDTRVAGWEWTAGDAALNPQVRQAIAEFGQVFPNFKAAFSALEEQSG